MNTTHDTEEDTTIVEYLPDTDRIEDMPPLCDAPDDAADGLDRADGETGPLTECLRERQERTAFRTP
ncbi:MAG: hypothetical protein AAFX56_09190 [Pseudomonadota bacterium]